MTDTPMTPEELAKVTRDARAWVERPSFSKKGWIDALCLALLQERARAKALAALVDELEPDARRWRKWRTQHPECLGGHPVVDAEGLETGETQYEWATPEWMDEAADRLADKEGT